MGKMNLCSKVACAFLKRAIAEGKTTNMVVSPLNLDAVIRTIAHACSLSTSKQGRLTSQILSDGPDPFPSVFNNLKNLQVVNHVFMDESIPMDSWYPEMMKYKYKAFIHPVNFRDDAKLDDIAEKINLCAERDTRGLIRRVIENWDMGTQLSLVVLNSLYYKGRWLHPFRSTSQPIEFYTIDGNSEKALFMISRTSFFHRKFDHFDLIKIPYENDDVSMYIFLPDQIDLLEQTLLDKKHNHLLCEDFLLDKSSESSSDSLWLPKFHVGYNTMKFLDVAKEYCTPALSDIPLPCISESGDLLTANVMHHCEIKVDEEGTEAASSTLKIVETCGWPKKKIVVDKPFVFMIRHDATKSILFLGIVMNPNQTQEQVLSC